MCGSKSPSAPAAPVLPEVPGLTPEELDAIQKSGKTIDQIGGILSGEAANLEQNRSLLQSFSGLYDEGGKINPDAVASLKTRLQGTVAQRTAIGQQAMDFLGTFFGAPDENTTLVTDRLQRALKGELPVSEGLKQDTQKQFELMKEAAGRRGIRIEGDTLDDATSSSTAGIRTLEEARKRVAAARSTESQQEISTGFQNLGFLNTMKLNNLSFAGGLADNASADIASSLGFLDSANSTGAANLLSPLLGYSQAQLGQAQPYTDTRLAQYTRDTNQAQLNYSADLANYQAQMQARNSFFSSLGRLGSMAGTAMILTPGLQAPGAAVLGGTAALGMLN